MPHSEPHVPTPRRSSSAPTRGCIVLAAYLPDEELFGRQLRSIQAQTVRDFRCLIVADGGADDVRAMLRRLVPGDARFEVIGADERLGFYRNFERGLAAVPPEAEWVALSDQDDEWYPDKLERMLPHLEDVAMVGAQARVVQHPTGRVLIETTDRRETTVEALMICNQFTGGMSVLRGSLLSRALPFPRYTSPAQVHDHWLAVVAACAEGARIIPDVVQDYVQHGGNVLGERVDDGGIGDAWRALAHRAAGGGGGPRARRLARAAYIVSAGWAEAMAQALVERFPHQDRRPARVRQLYGPQRKLLRTALVLARTVARRRVPPRNAAVYLIGAALRPLARR